MSLLEKLFGGLFGEEEEKEEQIEHPCSNCPSSCTIAPAACEICKPYKAQMVDAIYRVEHKDEIISQYEVVGTNTQEGTVICPNCGGHSENHYVCEYCGSKLQDGSGKIQVASAADIPNPVLEAQDIIFKRYDAVKGYAGADSGYGYEDALSGIGSQGLFSSIFEALLGTDTSSSSSDSKSIGKKMTEDEIEEMAKYYGVSVSDYLTGLDNGKYLTMSNKNAAAKAEENYAKTASASQSSQGGGLGDLGGMAGMMGLGSLLFGGSTYNTSAARDPYQYHKKPGVQSQVKPGTQSQVKHGRVEQTFSTTGQRKPGYNEPVSSKTEDPRLKNAAGSDLRASQVKKEAEARKAEQARKEAEARKAEQARKEAEARKAEQARKEAEARKAEQARREAEARKLEEARKAQMAAGNDKLDAGMARGGGRRAAQSKEPDPNAKAPGAASGMGRRPGKPI